MKHFIYVSLFFATVGNADLDTPLQSISCSKPGVSYTVVITASAARSPRVRTNVSITKVSVNPDGTARIEYDDETTTVDRDFDTREQARRFFDRSHVILRSDAGEELILSTAKRRLMRLQAQIGIADELICR